MTTSTLLLVAQLTLVSECLRLDTASNQSMKPTAPLRNAHSVIATTPCRGLSLSRWANNDDYGVA
jgi:hypothetical protein